MILNTWIIILLYQIPNIEGKQVTEQPQQHEQPTCDIKEGTTWARYRIRKSYGLSFFLLIVSDIILVMALALNTAKLFLLKKHNRVVRVDGVVQPRNEIVFNEDICYGRRHE